MNQSQNKKQKTIENKKMITDRIDKPLSKDNIKNKKSDKNAQRALVLQGGGALAAYEAGVYGMLYFWRRKEIEKEKHGRNENHIFDIICGTSGGAINGWIVINHVQAKMNQGYSVTDSWKGSFKKLIDFWDYTSSSPDFTKWGPYSVALEVERIPGFPPYSMWKWPSDEKVWISRWNREHEKTNKSVATGEAARRYYCSKEYLYSGADNVFSRVAREHDSRFFDDIFPPSNTWYQYSNQPLRASIEKFSSLESIATTYDNSDESSGSSSPQGQEKKEKPGPRLLVVAVDVERGQAVTFDSYEKKDGARKTDYQEYDDGDINQQQSSSPPPPSPPSIALTYNSGIKLDHVMASASVPVNYDYALVPIDSSDLSKGNRRFWDGGVLSNTPLRELIQAHEDYWNVKRTERAADNNYDNNGKNIPNLEVYIANIWPSSWKGIPLDHDAVKDRKFDLTYKDKTLQEEKIAYLIRDYIELAKKLMDLAKEKGSTETEIDNYLNNHLTTKSKHRDGKDRTHQELLQNKVEITKIMRIERRYDPDDISYKWCDYSCDTVSHMIERGMAEALENIIDREKKEDPLHFNIGDELEKFINLVNREKEEEGLTQKQGKILAKPAADLLKEVAMNTIRAHRIA